MTVNKQRYWLIWVGKVTMAFFILYGFIKPDLVYVVGGVTIGVLTLLHQKAVVTKTPKDVNKYSENKLNKEELLGWLRGARENGYLVGVIPYGDDRFEQAYQQIKEMIQASTNLKNKSLGRLAQDLGVSFSATKIIHDHAQPEAEISPRLEYDDDGNVVEMGISGGIEQKPKITEEWIEEKAWKLRDLIATLIKPEINQEEGKARLENFIRSLVEELRGVSG